MRSAGFAVSSLAARGGRNAFGAALTDGAATSLMGAACGFACLSLYRRKYSKFFVPSILDRPQRRDLKRKIAGPLKPHFLPSLKSFAINAPVSAKCIIKKFPFPALLQFPQMRRNNPSAVSSFAATV